MKSTVSRFEVGQHLGADGRQPGLGVTMGGGRQAGDGAEIALRMHQAIAHVPVLGHAHQRRIDRLIAVRMVALHRLADDAGALAGRAGRAEAEVVHGHEDAPLRRFEAVAHVGQGPTDDDAHGVGEVAVLQLVGDVERIVPVAVAVWGRAEDCSAVRRVESSRAEYHLARQISSVTPRREIDRRQRMFPCNFLGFILAKTAVFHHPGCSCASRMHEEVCRGGQSQLVRVGERMNDPARPSEGKRECAMLSVVNE